MAVGNVAFRKKYDYFKKQGMGDEEALLKANDRNSRIPTPPKEKKVSWYDKIIQRIKRYYKKKTGGEK